MIYGDGDDADDRYDATTTSRTVQYEHCTVRTSRRIMVFGFSRSFWDGSVMVEWVENCKLSMKV